MSRVVRSAALAAVLVGFHAAALAQARLVAPPDIERLQARIDEVRDQVAQLPPDTPLRRELSAQLDELNDGTIALKTRIRAENVPMAEVEEAMGQLAGIEDQARRALSAPRGALPGSPGPPPAASAPPGPAAPPPPALPPGFGPRALGVPEAPPPPPATSIARPVAPEPPPPPPAGLQTAVPEPPPPPPARPAAPAPEPPPPPPLTITVPVSVPPLPAAQVSEAGEPAAASPAPIGERAAALGAPGELPSGTQFDVRLVVPLSSGTAQVEDRFEAATLVDLFEGPRLVVPAGSRMRGVVSAVERPGRLDRKGSLALTFDQLTVTGTAYPIRGAVVQTIESRGVRADATRIGVGAGVGAILGGILAGPQGAAAGVFIGTGGVLAALPGKDVELPAGTIVRVRLEQSVVIR